MTHLAMMEAEGVASGSPREEQKDAQPKTPWGVIYDLRRLCPSRIRHPGGGDWAWRNLFPGPGRVACTPAREPSYRSSLACLPTGRIICCGRAKSGLRVSSRRGEQAQKTLGILGQLPVRPHCEQPEPWQFWSRARGRCGRANGSQHSSSKSAQVFRVHHPVVALGIAKSALARSL